MIGFLALLALAAALWLLGRTIGNGRCHECGRWCAPWSVYCAEHDPYGGAR